MSDNPNDGTFGLPLEHHPKPNDEVRAAIERALRQSGIQVYVRDLFPLFSAISAEPVLAEMMKDVYVKADWENFNGMSAAFKALAEACKP